MVYIKRVSSKKEASLQKKARQKRQPTKKSARYGNKSCECVCVLERALNF
jgi:hypothetical protein